VLCRGEVAEGGSLEGKCEAAGGERKQGSRGVGEESQTANNAAVVGGVGRGLAGPRGGEVGLGGEWRGAGGVEREGGGAVELSREARVGDV
jgi:hypothetical protein